MHNLRFLLNLACICARFFDYFSRFLLQAVSTTPFRYFVSVVGQTYSGITHLGAGTLGYPQYFLRLGLGLLPIFVFWGPLHPIALPFFNFGPGAMPMSGPDIQGYYYRHFHCHYIPN